MSFVSLILFIVEVTGHLHGAFAPRHSLLLPNLATGLKFFYLLLKNSRELQGFLCLFHTARLK